MTANRSPLGIVVNGAYMQVRDPNAASGAFMATYRTVPGLGSFTLPAEAGSTNETALMDGTVGAAAFAGVGTITGSVGALGVHPTHLFLEEAKLDARSVQMSIVRLAVNVQDIMVPASGSDSVVDQSDNPNRIKIPVAVRSTVRSAVRQGCLIALSAAAASPRKQTLNTVVEYSANASGANDRLWQLCYEVADDGSYIDVTPGFSADVGANNQNALLQVRNPGRTYAGILGTVNQWDAGDYQNGQNVAGNITFTPTSALPRVAVESRVSLA